MIEELYPKFVTNRKRLNNACVFIQYLLLASLFMAITLYVFNKKNVTFFIYVNYHYYLRYFVPSLFLCVPIIITALYWISTSNLFIKLNYNAGNAFRKESKKDFLIRQARYSCGTWFSWLAVSTIFILIALSSICSDWDYIFTIRYSFLC